MGLEKEANHHELLQRSPQVLDHVMAGLLGAGSGGTSASADTALATLELRCALRRVVLCCLYAARVDVYCVGQVACML